MQSKKDGGPARPIAYEEDNGYGTKFLTSYHGMTLRDEFAGRALAGMLASPHVADFARGDFAPSLAARAYELADALIAEREA